MAATAPYSEQLRNPQPCDHLIQLYTDDAFLGRVVGEFLAAGLATGQAAIIIATPAHVALFRDRLAAAGFDLAAAQTAGQLVVKDAHACLAEFMVDGMPDRERFFAMITPVLAPLPARGYARSRLYGEMVDLLWDHSLPATVALEELWNEVLDQTGVSLLCAYRIDNFDRSAHRGVLHQVTACHSQLIPVEDYERLERAVDRAYEDVFGRDADTRLLRQHIVTQYGEAAKMPPSEAALLALRGFPRQITDAVIERARHHYRA